MGTIAQVFKSKNLWAWFDSPVTNAFDGKSEKGEDYSTTFGTPVAVPVGGTIKRIVHNNNAINDVVELMASDGSVWLYQHITTKVAVGNTLQCGSVIGTENGLPVDQYSTGPHIEVRYCPPGQWKASTDSWDEPWINPRLIFAGIGAQTPGSVDSGSGGSTNPVTQALNGITKGNISISPTADVVTLLWTLDKTLEVINPFDVSNAQQDSIAGVSFTDPISWLEGFGGNVLDDLTAIFVRGIFLLFGLIIIYKGINQYVDVGAAVDSAVNGVKTIGMVAAL